MTHDDSCTAQSDVAGHIPVLLAFLVEALGDVGGKRILDGTFGGGGYSRALLEQGAQVVAIDRDPDAVKRGKSLQQSFPDTFDIYQTTFSDMPAVVEKAGWADVDAVLLDIGVSSYQLDEAERGFSYHHDGPLDMRMGSEGATAADCLNTAREEELADIFYYYGEEVKARVLAKKIVARRKKTPFRTTKDLLAVVEEVYPGKRNRKHPAARIFQALRIAVNGELDELEEALPAAAGLLADGGKLAVVSFHSLEDRIAKNFMRDMEKGNKAVWKRQNKKPVVPSEDEVEANPRSRSAKLRVLQKTGGECGA